MGGWGSGRREYATTPTVEECRHLVVTNLKEFSEHPGAEGAVLWGDRENPAMTIGVLSEGNAGLEDETRASQLRLQYTVTNKRTGETREYDYAVPLDYTECHFGGYRPWFRCFGCAKRRGKLYLPPSEGKFACRECYELGYTSSRTSGDDLKQAELRYRRTFAKADKDDRRPHPNGEPPRPERPKGMHEETFDKLLWDVEMAELAWTMEMRKQTEALLDYCQTDRVS